MDPAGTCGLLAAHRNEMIWLWLQRLRVEGSCRSGSGDSTRQPPGLKQLLQPLRSMASLQYLQRFSFPHRSARGANEEDRDHSSEAQLAAPVSKVGECERLAAPACATSRPIRSHLQLAAHFQAVPGCNLTRLLLSSPGAPSPRPR